MTTPNIWIIEGIDRCSKSTLIKNLVDRLGASIVIPSGKPQVLEAYMKPGLNLPHGDVICGEATREQIAQALYQHDYFKSAFSMCANQKARIIFDRLHLGEMVYSPMYRNIIPHSVMNNEAGILGGAAAQSGIRLILMTEDFERSKHFVSDGLSFDDSKRQEEQNRFLEAFNKSVIRDKRIINVTAEDGSFRCEKDLLIDAVL